LKKFSVDNDPGVCGAYVTVPSPSLNDNCSASELELVNSFTGTNDASGIYPVGLTSVIWTVTDVAGNSNECLTEIVVKDVEDPIAECQDITVYLDNSNLINIIPEMIDDESSDLCGAVGLSLNIYQFDCSNVGNNVVMLTVSDNSGNTSNCSATVTVIDETQPSIVEEASNLILECNHAENTSDLNLWLTNHGGASAIDVCGEITWTNDYLSLSDDCGATGNVLVTFTASDQYGNSVNTTAMVVIEDNTPPLIIEEPMDITVECDGEGNTSDFDNWVANHGYAVAEDACGGVTWSYGYPLYSMDCGNTGSLQITFIATDECGLSSSTQGLFTIVDNTPPAAICENITVELNGNGVVNIIPEDVDAGSFDLCNNISLSLDIDNFTCENTGPNLVTLTITDDCENSSQCEAMVTVEDNTIPIISGCPQEMAFCGAQTVNWTPPTVSDNCLVSFSGNHIPGTFFDVGTSTVTYTAIDAGGNETACSFDIIIHPLPDITVSISELPEFCQGYAILEATVNNESDLEPEITYQWSNDLGNENFIQVFANNEYSITVTDGNGCESTFDYILDIDPWNSCPGMLPYLKRRPKWTSQRFPEEV
jgi:hypothetical protein